MMDGVLGKFVEFPVQKINAGGMLMIKIKIVVTIMMFWFLFYGLTYYVPRLSLFFY
jgi:hypothetical protein